MDRQISRIGRVRTLARECGAAFLLTMSVLTALPDPSYEQPPAIVRMARQSRGAFDEREWIGMATVLTMPLNTVERDQLPMTSDHAARDRLN